VPKDCYFWGGPFSNFYYSPFRIKRIWPTVEHFYQAMKTADKKVQEEIRLLSSPKAAKFKGRMVLLRPNWEETKEKVMLEGLRAKFFQHEDLKKVLLDTGDQVLHERSPNDMYWGYKGKDRLGILLMQVRKELKRKGEN